VAPVGGGGGPHATQFTPWVCPLSTCVGWGESIVHRRTVLSCRRGQREWWSCGCSHYDDDDDGDGNGQSKNGRGEGTDAAVRAAATAGITTTTHQRRRREDVRPGGAHPHLHHIVPVADVRLRALPRPLPVPLADGVVVARRQDHWQRGVDLHASNVVGVGPRLVHPAASAGVKDSQVAVVAARHDLQAPSHRHGDAAVVTSGRGGVLTASLQWRPRRTQFLRAMNLAERQGMPSLATILRTTCSGAGPAAVAAAPSMVRE